MEQISIIKTIFLRLLCTICQEMAIQKQYNFSSRQKPNVKSLTTTNKVLYSTQLVRATPK